MKDFLKRVMEQRNAEQLERERIAAPPRHCDICGRELKPTSTAKACFNCRQWLASEFGPAQAAHGKSASPTGKGGSEWLDAFTE